jgi:hypothetical protein
MINKYIYIHKRNTGLHVVIFVVLQQTNIGPAIYIYGLTIKSATFLRISPFLHAQCFSGTSCFFHFQQTVAMQSSMTFQ